MDARGKKHKGKGGYESSNSTNPCSFYKLMISPTIQFKMLRLPDTFAMTFGDDLSEVCSLTVPTGETHQVALVEENDHLWFQDGWKQFVDRFSIGYGYFMTFTYLGNSKFEVCLFDLSACEISYGDRPTTSVVPNIPFSGDQSPTFSDEFEDGAESADCNNNVGPENLPSMSASRKNGGLEVVELDSEDDETESDELSEVSRKTTKYPIWVQPFRSEMKQVIAAGIPVPTNPFFVAVMRQYNINSGGFLNVPRAFARAYMKHKVRELALVEMGDGSQWPVRCCRNSTYCSLGKGWVQVTRRACLKVEDVCLFELIDAKNCVLKVQVVKSS
ncbi:hypothetical protein RND81_02G004300 [Saponaria officinalis]|uniref:TF-B3 domain-containing protein n=1 Tax=Saponaria officinalis TaxID=3572 RepID=A0AAW1MM93_SAPOF